MMKCFCTDSEKIEENVQVIRENIAEAAAACGRSPEEIAVMAVTKTVPPERVNLALKAGISLLGENRVQEFCEKHQNYACNQETIHFIGHLQTNKIRDIIEKIGMIESADSVHLAGALQKACEKHCITQEILLQVNIGREETKSGFMEEQVQEALDKISFDCPLLKVRGLMTVPPKSDSDLWLGRMQQLFESLRSKGYPMEILSMGMSADYQRAVKFGSTQVRIGSAIFGERNYKK